MKNKILEISAARSATPVNPNTAAITAMIMKIMVQRSIKNGLFVLDTIEITVPFFSKAQTHGFQLIIILLKNRKFPTWETTSPIIGKWGIL